jgi:hypothetical protein
MPYRGESPVEAWEFWFDEPPSAAVSSSLEQLRRDYVATSIIEAIEITGNKLDITDEVARLQYVKGVLRRKVLQAVAPERAELEAQIDRVLKSWYKTSLGRWPLNRKSVAKWLEIQTLMHVAHNWRDFKSELDQAIETRQRNHPISTDAS